MGKKYESITRQITFPKVLMDKIDVKAGSLGYSFPAYVRYVLAKEIEEKQYPVLDGVVIDEKMIEGLKKAKADSEAGKLKELRNEKEIREYFKKISDEES